MNSNQPSNKKKNRFTIIKDDSNDGHGGYGAGSISLENMSSVIVDPNEKTAYLDMDAMHARSAIERRVKYMPDREDVPNPKKYWIVWVTVEQGKKSPYYAGVAGCELLVDKPNKRAYKSMPEHVQNMEASLKGKIIVDHMDDLSKQLLHDYLKDFNQEFWEHSTEELKSQLNIQ